MSTSFLPTRIPPQSFRSSGHGVEYRGEEGEETDEYGFVIPAAIATATAGAGLVDLLRKGFTGIKKVVSTDNFQKRFDWAKNQGEALTLRRKLINAAFSGDNSMPRYYNPPGPKGGPGAGRRGQGTRILTPVERRMIKRLTRHPGKNPNLYRLVKSAGFSGEDLVLYGAEEVLALQPNALEIAAESVGAEEIGDDEAVGADELAGQMGEFDYEDPGSHIMTSADFDRSYRINVEREPAPGVLTPLALYTPGNVATKNPLITLACTGTGAIEATTTLTTVARPWQFYQIKELVVDIRDIPQGSSVNVRNLFVNGANIDLVNGGDSTGWLPAVINQVGDSFRMSIRSSTGTVIQATNTASMDISISGINAGTAAVTASLMGSILSDAMKGLKRNKLPY